MIKNIIYLAVILLQLNLFSMDYYYNNEKKVKIIKNNKYLSLNLKKIPNIDNINKKLSLYKGLYTDIKFGNKNRVFIKLVNEESGVVIKTALKELYDKEYSTYYVKSIHNNVDVWPISPSDNIIIQFRNPIINVELSNFMIKYRLKLERKSKLSENLYIFKTENQNPIKIANEIYESGIAKISEPDFYIPYQKMYFPNDEFYNEQWHLKDAVGGTWAAKGWNYLESLLDFNDINIKIAIIDDGIDLNHEDLNIITHKNFTEESYDQGGRHGTACAGVAAAKGNNSLGVVGGCPHCDIISAKMMNGDDNYGYTTSTPSSDAIKWATDNGADVISNSWGYKVYIPIPSYMTLAIEYAVTRGRDRKGAIVVFAAGNDDRMVENDELAANKDIIAVAASTNTDTRSYYSNYGPSIDVCAPSSGGSKKIVTADAYSPTGVDIRGYNLNGWDSNNNPELDPYGKYTKSFGGTSSATPLVSGLAALVLAKSNDLGYLELREIIRNGARKIGGLSEYNDLGHSNKFGYGKIDFEKTLMISPSSISCIPSSSTEICDNNRDDDCDTKVDMADSDCLKGNNCKSTLETITKTSQFTADTSLNIYTNDFIAPTLNDCSGGTNSNDIAYRVFIEKPTKATFEIKNATWDSVIYLRKSSCDNSEAISCNDESNGKLSKITIELETGVYFLIIDGYGSFDQGEFLLDVIFENLDDPCENEVCSSHGICKSVLATGAKECLCDDAYYASEMNCLPLTEKCDGLECSNHGTCVISQREALCVCDDNYKQEGLSCSIIDLCIPQNCVEREYCSQDTDYKCVCKEEYYRGINGHCILNTICEEECGSNSSCVKDPNLTVPKCACNDGYKNNSSNECISTNSGDSCSFVANSDDSYMFIFFIMLLFFIKKFKYFFNYLLQ